MTVQECWDAYKSQEDPKEGAAAVIGRLVLATLTAVSKTASNEAVRNVIGETEKVFVIFSLQLNEAIMNGKETSENGYLTPRAYREAMKAYIPKKDWKRIFKTSITQA